MVMKTSLLDPVIEWQPIETAPKDRRVLIYVPLGPKWTASDEAEFGPSYTRKWLVARWEAEIGSAGAWVAGGELWSDETVVLLRDNERPTHWMPLPDAPAGLR